MKSTVVLPRTTTHIVFNRMRTIGDLAARLGCDPERLLVFGDTVTQHGFYSELSLPKRGKKNRGKIRIVYKVKDEELERLQKDIATAIALQVEMPASVYGFVAGGSTKKNAEKHLGKRIVKVFDILHFFESINTKLIIEAFLSLGWSRVIAETLARMCTRKGVLPPGAPSSPTISNVVFIPYDKKLEQLASQLKCTYTRYADDLTFSGDIAPTDEQIINILAPEFSLHKEKTRCQTRGNCQFVTGLTVCDLTGPRVPRGIKRRVRLDLHYAQTLGLQKHCAYHKINPYVFLEASRGRINYIRSVERELGNKLRSQLNDIEASYESLRGIEAKGAGSSD